MIRKAIQDDYEDKYSQCYGCGRLNQEGLQIKSHWDGKESVCTFKPKPYHISVPGYVYGGLIASIIDCHCVATAGAATSDQAGVEIASLPFLCLTKSLHVDYLKPVPLEATLEVRASVKETRGRRVVVVSTLSVEEEVCARGEVVVAMIPANRERYNLAVEIVADWTKELMRSGFEREDALKSILLLMELGLLSSMHEEAGAYRTEIESVIRSQLGEISDR